MAAGLERRFSPSLRPLTLSNAVIAVTNENNRLFPERPVPERKVCISTGPMNVVGASVGGVPRCRGAGRMAGHVSFGACIGGALVILAALLLFLALFLSSSVHAIFQLIPTEILGVVLFLTGAHLALGSRDFSKDERFASIVTAGFSMWLALYHLMKRGWARM